VFKSPLPYLTAVHIQVEQLKNTHGSYTCLRSSDMLHGAGQ